MNYQVIIQVTQKLICKLYSSRYLSGFNRTIPKRNPSGILSDDPTKDTPQMKIIIPPSAPSETPTKYQNHVTK